MKNNSVLNCGAFEPMTMDEMMSVDGGSFWSWIGHAASSVYKWTKKNWKTISTIGSSVISIIKLF